MKLTISHVERLLIEGIAGMDPLTVYLEDLGPGCGKITVSCYDETWTHYWGSMGKGQDIRSFFLSCDLSYIVNKFSPGLSPCIADLGKLVETARHHICSARRKGELERDVAKELFDEADCLSELEDSDPAGYRQLMYRIFGDEWWHSLPQKANEKYEYLCRIVTIVQEAIGQDDNSSDEPLAVNG